METTTHHQGRSLTPRQHAVLQAVLKLTNAEGIPPSVRELAAEMGVTSTAITATLSTLQIRGFVVRRHRIARGLLLTNAGLAEAAGVQQTGT